MRNVIVAAFLFSICAFAQTQQQPTSVNDDLSGKTPTQLVDCFSDPGRCGAANKWDIADVVGKRKNESFLIREFSTRKDPEQKLGIIYALYRINDPEVTTFFEHLVADRFDDGEGLYYPLNYLAKKCEPDALRVLSGDENGGYHSYPGCLQWATTVELFGKCKYKPAVPYLIDSIDAACMNIGVAAVDSLREIYPGSPKSFQDYSREQIQTYFRRRADAENEKKR